MDKQKVQQFILDARKNNVPDSVILSYIKERGGITNDTPDKVTGVPGVAVGAAKGAATTATGLGEMASKYILRPYEKAVDTLATKINPDAVPVKSFVPTEQEYANDRQNLKPQGAAEKIGFGAEQIGEFFIPSSKTAQIEKVASEAATKFAASKIPEGAPALVNKAANVIADVGAKSVTRAAEGGAIIAAQTGGNEKDIKDAAIISAVFPALGKTASTVADVIKTEGKNFAPRLINSLIKPLAKDLSYGKNPGRAVAEEGITANSLEDLAQKISQRASEVGSEINDIVVKATNNGKVVDLTNALSPLDDAIAQAKKSPRTNSSLITRLEDIKLDLTSGKDLSKMTPEEAFKFKQDVADITKFTGNMSDDNAVNKPLKQIYGKIKGEINKASSGIKSESGNTIEKLSEKYADLKSAEVATKYRDVLAERQNIISLPQNISAIGGALSTAVLSGGAAVPTILVGASGVALDKVLSSPSFKTKFAKWLVSSSPEQKNALYKAVPALRGAVIKAFVGE